jgi:hypothetical protein
MVVIGGLLAPIGGKTPQNRLKRPDDTVVRPSRRRPRGFSTSSCRSRNPRLFATGMDGTALVDGRRVTNKPPPHNFSIPEGLAKRRARSAA